MPDYVGITGIDIPLLEIVVFLVRVAIASALIAGAVWLISVIFLMLATLLV